MLQRLTTTGTVSAQAQCARTARPAERAVVVLRPEARYLDTHSPIMPSAIQAQGSPKGSMNAKDFWFGSKDGTLEGGGVM